MLVIFEPKLTWERIRICLTFLLIMLGEQANLDNQALDMPYFQFWTQTGMIPIDFLTLGHCLCMYLSVGPPYPSSSYSYAIYHTFLWTWLIGTVSSSSSLSPIFCVKITGTVFYYFIWICGLMVFPPRIRNFWTGPKVVLVWNS